MVKRHAGQFGSVVVIYDDRIVFLVHVKTTYKSSLFLHREELAK